LVTEFDDSVPPEENAVTTGPELKGERDFTQALLAFALRATLAPLAWCKNPFLGFL
jgi:hypothetical protein